MIIAGSDFDAMSDVSYTKAKINASGGKSVAILNSSINKALNLSSPLMMTWGMNEWTNDQTGANTYDLSLQFPREQDSNFTEDTQAFLDALVAFEDRIKSDASSMHCKDWFNKPKMSPEVVDALFTPMLRYPKGEDGEPDRSRAPSLRVKIPYWENNFDIELYDMNGQVVFPSPEDDSASPMSIIQKGQNIAVVIKCGGLWFANGKFGVTWRLVQAVVQPRASLKGRCHIQLGTTERAIMQSAAATTEADDDVNDTDNEEDAGEENEAEPEPEPEPEPKKVAPKKRVVRKAKKTTD